MSDNQNRIPSFDEVMGKDTLNGKVPSFEDIMGDEPPVKKKSFWQRAKVWWHSWYLRSPIGRKQDSESLADSEE